MESDEEGRKEGKWRWVYIGKRGGGEDKSSCLKTSDYITHQVLLSLPHAVYTVK